MKTLKLTIILFSIAMLVNIVLGIKSELQADYEAVKEMGRWLK